MSGSGKTTTARRIAERLGHPWIELDAVFWGPNWKQPDREAFRESVAEMTGGFEWVVDGNYGSWAADIIWDRADTIVWLDMARHTVMRRIAVRTLGRMAFRRELWNGNRERFANLIKTAPEDNIVLWAWTQYHPLRKRYEEWTSDPRFAHLDVIRLRRPGEVETWLRSL